MQISATYVFSHHPTLKIRPYMDCSSEEKHPVAACKASVCTAYGSQIRPARINSSSRTEATYKQKAPAAYAGRGSIEKKRVLLVVCFETLHHLVEISLCALQAVMIASVP